ncbi:MAG: hypothetical protein QXJ06_00430 [Candidatus Aenigmatarchaeota archaeon]
MNLANAIITSKEICSLDENFQPRKGILNKTKIKELNYNNILLNYSYIDYDYSIKINVLETNENYYLGYSLDHLNELFEIGKKCRTNLDYKQLKNYKIPIIIEENEKKQDGYLYLTLVKTPINIISSELNFVCQKDFYETKINIFGFNEKKLEIKKIDENNYDICITTYKNIKMCKKLRCEKEIVLEIIYRNCRDLDNRCNKGCSYFFDKDCKKETCAYALIKSNDKKVILCFAEKEKDLELC